MPRDHRSFSSPGSVGIEYNVAQRNVVIVRIEHAFQQGLTFGIVKERIEFAAGHLGMQRAAQHCHRTRDCCGKSRILAKDTAEESGP
jgi:hypothetical protein